MIKKENLLRTNFLYKHHNIEIWNIEIYYSKVIFKSGLQQDINPNPI